jgi:hypothetical protein
MAIGIGASMCDGVVFLVQHLVADQRPAGSLDHADVEPLLFVEAQRVGHDQRAGAGDRDEADLEVLFLQAAFFLRHGFQRTEGDQRGDRGPGRRGADCGKELAPFAVMREQRLHYGGLDHATVQGIDVAGRGGDVVLGLRGVFAASAGIQLGVGVEWIVQCHGALPVDGMGKLIAGSVPLCASC